MGAERERLLFIFFIYLIMHVHLHFIVSAVPSILETLFKQSGVSQLDCSAVSC